MGNGEATEGQRARYTSFMCAGEFFVLREEAPVHLVRLAAVKQVNTNSV